DLLALLQNALALIQNQTVHRAIFKIEEFAHILFVVVHVKFFMIVKRVDVIARNVTRFQSMLDRR
ncbi:hypothetical protein OFN51_36825, partial [Escherichia coli]|nr:hypothetical protein [Escherichia coli]